MNNNSASVYVLILNYNSFAETIECYESIRDKVVYQNFHVMIIDNHSTDDSAEKLKKYFESVSNTSLLFNNVNYGYAHGNNVGIKKALENQADYILIMNPDVRIYNDIISEMTRQFEMDDNIGILGTGIFFENNQNMLEGCGHKINRLTAYTTNIVQKGTDINTLQDKLISCDYVGGMCIGVRATLIDEIGFIPEGYFLFYEETEWCKITKKHGFKVLTDINAKIYHKGSASIDKVSNGRINLHQYYLFRNRVIYQKRTENRLCFILFMIYYLVEIAYERIKGHYPKEAVIGWYDGLVNKDRLGKIKSIKS